MNRRSWITSAVAFSACSGAKRLKIAVIPKATSHQFWLTVQKGALAAGRESNVDIEWNGAATETEYARQIQIVESAINRRVDGIALAPTERQALRAAVERAADVGIPVTIFDSGIDTERYISFVGSDNRVAGALAGRELARRVGEGKVAMLMNAPGSASTLEREQGFEEAIREFPKIQIVARQFSLSDRARARANAENFLTAHPDLKGMFGSTDPSATGAALAVKARGLAGRVKIVAFDLSPSLLEDLRASVIDAMVIQDPERMGHEAVATVVQKLRGQQPPRHVDLAAVTVTRENMSDPAVRKLLTA